MYCGSPIQILLFDYDAACIIAAGKMMDKDGSLSGSALHGEKE
jgi:hypothetical protein